MTAKVAGVLFDAYGTLFDVHAVEGRLESLFPGKGQALSQRWRDKQLAYTWLRTLSGGYADFWAITADALDYACEFERVKLTVEGRAELLATYERLPLFPEVAATLRDLRARGFALGVLSNAGEAMLAKALVATGIDNLFATVLSVERVRKFKTAPEAYSLGPQAFGVPAQELALVSSNGWDAAGAAAFGYRAFWINRNDAPRERFGAAPAGEGRTMADLAAFLEA